MNLKLIRSMIRSGKVPRGGFITHSAPRGYFLAVGTQIFLFLVSLKLVGESEAIFGLVYILFAMAITVLEGQGAGFLAGFLAALSVDYHYIHPAGSFLRTPDSYIFLFLSLAIVQLTGMGTRYLAKIVNTSEKARSDLEIAVHSREEVLAVVAHDLRQPLSVLKLKQEMTLRHLDRGNLDSAKSLLIDGRNALQQMNSLIQDLLDGSKIDSGKMHLTMADADVDEVCRHNYENFLPQAARKRIRLTYRRSSPGPSIFSFDAHRISRVISNLLSNALKFTPENGEIELSLSTGVGETVEIRVRDSGAGIPEHSVENLFHRHWQAKETAHLGTGLGLYICRGIVEAHRGTIWYEAKEKAGATFCFQIPMAPAHAPVCSSHGTAESRMGPPSSELR